MVAEPLTDEEIDRFLEEAGTGVLSLADGSDTYAVPMSFGYDGKNLYFQFVYTDGSRKLSFFETTGTATFTTYSTDEPARSVVVRGTLQVVPDEEEIVASIAIIENAATPTLNVTTSETLEEVSFDYYQLAPSEISGRRFE